MKQLLLLQIILLCSSCAQSQTEAIKQQKDTTAQYDIGTVYFSSILQRCIVDSNSSHFLVDYNQLRDSIQRKRMEYVQSYARTDSLYKKDRVLDSTSYFLQNALVKNIFPYWYGTQWDFNGITETPQKGFIACGYFVSTTLKHAGFNLNRYRLAQQYSHSIVKTLCSDLQRFTVLTSMLIFIKDRPDQLYIVGLDNHVGFIYKENSSIYFIHSSFVSPGYVVSEKAEDSSVLTYSNVYILGSLTYNKSILKKWLKNEAIQIIP